MDIRKFFSRPAAGLHDDDCFQKKKANRKRSRAKGVFYISDSSDDEVTSKKEQRYPKSCDVSSSTTSTKKKIVKTNTKSAADPATTLKSTTPSDFFSSFKDDSNTAPMKKRKVTSSAGKTRPKVLKVEMENVNDDDICDLLDEKTAMTMSELQVEIMSWETDDDCSDEDYLHFVDNVEDGTGFYCRARRFDEKSSDDMMSHNEQDSAKSKVDKDTDRETSLKTRTKQKPARKSGRAEKKGMNLSKTKMTTSVTDKVATKKSPKKDVVKSSEKSKENKVNVSHQVTGHVTDSREKKDKKSLNTKQEDLRTPEKKFSAESEQQPSSKKERFMKYQQWQNRAGPSAPGSKEVPQGAENCFEGLTFVITGVQESLNRDEVTSLVERYGGKVTSAVSGRTSYLIAGDDAGQTKMQKAQKLNTKIINEDEFLDLIRTTPSKKSKYDVYDEPHTSSSALNSGIRSTGRNLLKEGGKQDSRFSVKSEFKAEESTASHAVSKLTGENQASGASQMMWVDKYKPTSIKQIIGQQGANSNVQKLIKWLQNWHANNRTESGRKKPKPRVTPWGGGDPTGASFKAALLSGPPGVGKTTSATLVCKELGYSYVELNASDTRSKRSLQEDVALAVENTSIACLLGSKAQTPVNNDETRHALIMDEVDGMAGNEDRGGMQELIQIIKSSKIPIICMCNDRSSPKMRSLTNYCFDLRFQRPRVEQITGFLMSVCYKEGLKAQAAAVQAITRSCNQDVRQVLHNLNMLKANSDSLTYDDAKKQSEKTKKDPNLGIFEIARALFSSDSAGMSLQDKTSLFFMDYSIVPKFVQENYLNINTFAAKGDVKMQLKLTSKAADCIATGDIIESVMRHDQSWSMLPVLGMMSTILPCDFIRGGMQGMINFPSFLGKLSTQGKNQRLLHELKFHSSIATGGSTRDTFALDLVSYLRWHLSHPLLKQSRTGENEVPAVTNLLSAYDFVREDYDNLMEVGQFEGKPNYMTKVDPKVKAAFTRTFNKESHLIPYAVLSAAAAKKKKKVDTDEGAGDSQSLEEGDNDDDDMEMDGMIKEAKKKTSAQKSQTKRSNTNTSHTSKKARSPKKTKSRRK